VSARSIREMNAFRVSAPAVLCLAAGTALRARCPDGTPPPCVAGRAAVAPRKVDPALDDRTWIVVPFNNVTRAPDADWWREAGVAVISGVLFFAFWEALPRR